LTLLNILQAFEEVEVDDPKERKQWCRDNYIGYKAMLQVLDARKQLRERVERLKIGDWETSCLGINNSVEGFEPVLNSLVSGLFANTAIRNEDGTYRHALTRQVRHIFSLSLSIVVD